MDNGMLNKLESSLRYNLIKKFNKSTTTLYLDKYIDICIEEIAKKLVEDLED